MVQRLRVAAVTALIALAAAGACSSGETTVEVAPATGAAPAPHAADASATAPEDADGEDTTAPDTAAPAPPAEGSVAEDTTAPDAAAAPPAEASDPDELVQYVVDERVQLPAGATGTTISGGVVRATADAYTFAAAAGQVMTLGIGSLEGNARFGVYGPDGTFLVYGQYEVVVLPADGDYQVVVSSDRGNATYDLYVDIRTREAGAMMGASGQRNPGGYAAYGVYDQLSFEPGTSSGRVFGEVAQGTADAYLIAATAGQEMELSATGADLEIYGPDGRYLGGGGLTHLEALPADGDYLVTLSSIWGDADYELFVWIG